MDTPFVEALLVLAEKLPRYPPPAHRDTPPPGPQSAAE